MARLKEEGGLVPRKIHNLADLNEALGDGYEYSADFKQNVLEEHALVVAAYHHPGSLLCGRLRPTMFSCSDYRRFWEIAEGVFKSSGVAGFTVSTVGTAMRHSAVDSHDPSKLVDVLQVSAPMELSYLEQNYVIQKIARHELARFQEKTKKLNDEASVAPTKELFGDYISAAQEIGRTAGAGATLRSVGEQMETWDPADAALRIVPSGLDTIDGVSGGGPGKGDLVVIGGGTNAGKSFLGEQILYSHSSLNQAFLYVSIEDDEDLMRCRIVARHTTPKQRPVWIRQKPTKPDEIALYRPDEIRRAQAFVAKDRNMYIARKRKGKVSAVIDILRRYRYEKGIVACMVDYLQALSPDYEAKGSPNIVQETAKKISQLKEAADGLGIPIYLTSQLTREGYTDGSEPQMNHVKYAGDIENEAEIVALLWRSQDQILHAKIAKAKWVETTTPRYRIHCDKISGTFGRWEPEFGAGGAQGAAGSGAPSGHRGSGRGRRDARQL